MSVRDLIPWNRQSSGRPETRHSIRLPAPAMEPGQPCLLSNSREERIVSSRTCRSIAPILLGFAEAGSAFLAHVAVGSAAMLLAAITADWQSQGPPEIRA